MTTFIVLSLFFFFFNDTATTEIYTLSLHDALPIFRPEGAAAVGAGCPSRAARSRRARSWASDRKSTRLNSSHANISYAVFCLKKKKNRFAMHRYINLAEPGACIGSAATATVWHTS